VWFQLQRARHLQRQAELEEARRQQFLQAQAQAAAQRRQQEELARQAEAARIAAAQQAAAANEAERLARERQREQAFAHLMLQAQFARENRNYPLAIQCLETCLTLKQSDDTIRQLALVRSDAERFARDRQAEELARREGELRKLREAQLVQAQVQLADERRRRLADEEALRKTQEAAAEANFQKLLADGRALRAQKK